VLLVWCASLLSCRGAREQIDLIERFNEAQKFPDAATFVIEDHTLAGEAHRAIAVAPVLASRLTWRLTVPRSWRAAVARRNGPRPPHASCRRRRRLNGPTRCAQ